MIDLKEENIRCIPLNLEKDKINIVLIKYDLVKEYERDILHKMIKDLGYEVIIIAVD